MTKFVFITGGVVSSLGKGIAAASLAAILETRGIKVTRIAQGVPMGGDLEYADQVTLARALSGDRHVARAAKPEVGWIELEVIASDSLYADVAPRHRVFASHFDEVREPPAPWRVLARSAGCAVQAMRFGDAPIWGIQAHPEITPRDARILIEGFLRYAPQLAPVMRPALEAEPRDDGTALPIVRRFLEL